ncbi:MAG: hypothetical protein FWD57_00010 [Polyangiaceae bacterium]|nr:hypothetical protein [Polyangiaceae bacterium]
MPRIARKIAVACAIASLTLVSCTKKQAEAPEVDPFADMGHYEAPPKAPEAPPPPKCESFDEECTAKSNTWLKVGELAEFQPPEAWIYAKLEEVSVAKIGSDAAIAYRVIPLPVEPKKNPNDAIAALAPIFQSMGVEVSANTLKTAFRGKVSVDNNGPLSLDTWEIKTGGKIDGAKAYIVVVASTLGSGDGLVGAVALKESAIQAHVESIITSYRSVRSLP